MLSMLAHCFSISGCSSNSDLRTVGASLLVAAAVLALVGAMVPTPAIGQKSPPTFEPVGAGLTGVEFDSSSDWGDFDEDGDLDLVVTGEDANSEFTATIYENQGGVTFEPVGAGLTGVEFASSDWGDFDGDSDLDLVVTGGDGDSEGTATIYENQGDGSNGGPEVPTDLQATEGQIDLTWSPGGDSNPDGYNVYRSTSSFSDISNATKLNDSLHPDASYVDADVTNGTEYFYRVTAVDGEGNESDLSGEASAVLQDLKLIGLEVNQSIQNWQNSVPLIEGKPTVVRAHIRNEGSGSAKVKGIRLKGTRNGMPLTGSPLEAENKATFLAPSDTSDKDIITARRSKWRKSLNFTIRNDQWLKETVTLRLIGDGLQCEGVPAVSESCEIEVDFQPVPELSVKFYRVKWYDLSGEPHQPSKEEIGDIAESLTAMYPTENVNFETAELLAPQSPVSAGGFSLLSVNDQIETMRILDLASGASSNRLYYGVVADADVAGLALSVGGNVASGNDSPTTVAHELGHLLDRPHAVNAEDNGRAVFPPGMKKGYCGSKAYTDEEFPYSEVFGGEEIAAIGPSGVDSEMWGYDSSSMEIVVYPYTGELMSYCNPRWVSEYTYENIKSSIANQFASGNVNIVSETAGSLSSASEPGSVSMNQAQDYTLIRGRVEVSDSLVGESVEFLPFVSFSASQAVADSLAPKPGDYTLQAIDEQGVTVEEVSFGPNLGVTEEISKSASFSVPVSNESNISEVKVRYEGEGKASGNVIGTTAASLNPPDITVESPNGGENLGGDQTTVKWSASDPDSDSLSYVVQYSQNGGNTWSTINAD